MTTEADFQRSLDLDPDNFGLRLIFADWLEERGDVRAAGMRWMGENGKWPNAHGNIGPYWSGIPHLDKDQDENLRKRTLPPAMLKALKGHIDRPATLYKEYRSRQAAEDALCHAIAALEKVPT